MNKSEQISIFLLRIALGWMFFYAGITKVLDPQWSAKGYLMGAKTFTWFYNLLASPSLLPFVDFLNKWGLTLIGLSLILGVFSKLSSLLGAILMLLYYFPILQFPYPNPHSFIVDEHIIYLLSLVLLYFLDADKHYGLHKFIFKK
jgi:thiosulfate dehydrogenase [quinone] large subunit